MRWIFLAVALVCLSAQSQQPSRESSKDKQRHTGPAQKQGAPDERGTEKSPVVVKVLPTPDDKEKAEQDRKEREEKAALDRRLVDLTGDLARYTDSLAVFTAVLAIATIEGSKRRFFAFGIIQYQDIFKKKTRTTRFCCSFRASGDPVNGITPMQAEWTRYGNEAD